MVSPFGLQLIIFLSIFCHIKTCASDRNFHHNRIDKFISRQTAEIHDIGQNGIIDVQHENATPENETHLLKIHEIRHKAMRNEQITDHATPTSSPMVESNSSQKINYAKYTFYTVLMIFIANALCLIYYIFGRDYFHRLSGKGKIHQSTSNKPPQFDENEIDKMILEIEDANVELQQE